MEIILEDYLLKLKTHNFSDADQLVEKIRNISFSSTAPSFVAFCSTVLFKSENSLISFLQSNVSEKEKLDVNCRKRVFQFVRDYIKKRGNSLIDYIPFIVESCFNLFLKDSANASKEAALLPIIQSLKHFEKSLIEEKFNIGYFYEKAMNLVSSSKIGAGTKGRIWQFLGFLISLFPDKLKEEIFGYRDIILSSLEDQFQSEKPQLTLMIGILKGFSICLNHLDYSQKRVRSLYILVKSATIPIEDTNSKKIIIVSLKILSIHSALFLKHILADAQDLLERLFDLVKNENRKIKERASDAVESIVSRISINMDENSTQHTLIFQFVTKKLESIILESFTSDMTLLTLSIRCCGHYSDAIRRFLGEDTLVKLFRKLIELSESRILKNFEEIFKGGSSSDKIKTLLYYQKQVSSFLNSFSSIILNLPKLTDQESQHILDCALLAVRNHKAFFDAYMKYLYDGLASLINAISKHSDVKIAWMKKFVHLSLLESITVSNSFSSGEVGHRTSLRVSIQLWKSLLSGRGMWNSSLKNEFAQILFETFSEISGELELGYKLSHSSDQLEIVDSEALIFAGDATNFQFIPHNSEELCLYFRLILVIEEILKVVDIVNLKDWVIAEYSFLEKQLNNYPRSIPFIKLVKALNMAVSPLIDTFFSEIKDLMKTFLKKLYLAQKEYQDELLMETLKCIFSFPFTLPETECIEIVEKALSLGVNHSNLAFSTLEFLQKIKMTKPMKHKIVPLLSLYLRPVKLIESKPFASEDFILSLSEDNWRCAKLLPDLCLKLLGKLGEEIYFLLNEETNSHSDNFGKLRIFIFLYDSRLELNLSKILPRILEIISSSEYSESKSSACKMLYFSIIYLIGNFTSEIPSGALPFYSKTILPMLELASDSSAPFYEMFNTLGLQISRWYGSFFDPEKSFIIIFLEKIFECISSEENHSLREMASMCISEFLRPSITIILKKRNVSFSSKIFKNFKAIVRRTSSLASNPNSFKKIGSLLALKQVIASLKASHFLAQIYTHEVIFHFLIIMKSVSFHDLSLLEEIYNSIISLLKFQMSFSSANISIPEESESDIEIEEEESDSNNFTISNDNLILWIEENVFQGSFLLMKFLINIYFLIQKPPLKESIKRMLENEVLSNVSEKIAKLTFIQFTIPKVSSNDKEYLESCKYSLISKIIEEGVSEILKDNKTLEFLLPNNSQVLEEFPFCFSKSLALNIISKDFNYIETFTHSKIFNNLQSDELLDLLISQFPGFPNKITSECFNFITNCVSKESLSGISKVVLDSISENSKIDQVRKLRIALGCYSEIGKSFVKDKIEENSAVYQLNPDYFHNFICDNFMFTKDIIIEKSFIRILPCVMDLLESEYKSECLNLTLEWKFSELDNFEIMIILNTWNKFADFSNIPDKLDSLIEFVLLDTNPLNLNILEMGIEFSGSILNSKGESYYNDFLAPKLEIIRSKYFPTKISELKSHSLEEKNFNSIVNSLGKFISKSRIPKTLENIFVLMKSPDHRNYPIIDFNNFESFSLLQYCLDIFFDSNIDKSVIGNLRIGIMKLILLPSMEKMGKEELVQILTEYSFNFEIVLKDQISSDNIDTLVLSIQIKSIVHKFYELIYSIFESSEIKERLHKSIFGNGSVGNELTKILILSCHNAKRVFIPEHEKIKEEFGPEILDEFYTSSYIALATILSKTQSKESVFNQFLFQTSREKGDKLWEVLYSCCEIPQFTEKAKQKTTELKPKVMKNESQREKDSILTIPKLDLSKIFSKFSAEDDFNFEAPNSDFLNDSEFDQITENPCTRRLILLFLEMNERFPSNNMRMPEWAKLLLNEFREFNPSFSVRIHLLRAITAIPHIFMRQAESWIPEFLNFLSGKFMNSEESKINSKLHFFNLKLLEVILLWIEGNPSVMDIFQVLDYKKLLCESIDKVLMMLGSGDKEVLMRNLDIFTRISSKFSKLLYYSKQKIIAMIQAPLPDKLDDKGKKLMIWKFIGFRVLQFAFENNIVVCNDFTEFMGAIGNSRTLALDNQFLAIISKFLLSSKKQISMSVAQTLASLLNAFPEVIDNYEKTIVQLSNSDKFMHSIFELVSNCPIILLKFSILLNRVTNELSSAVKSNRYYSISCISVFVGNLSAKILMLPESRIVDEIAYGVLGACDKILSDSSDDSQIAFISMLVNLTELATKSSISSMFEAILPSIQKSNNKIKGNLKSFYDLLMILFPNTLSSSLKKGIIDLFVVGASCEFTEIRKSIIEFIEKSGILGHKAEDRLLYLLENIYRKEHSDAFLCLSSSLLLSLTEKSSDYEREIYDEPLTHKLQYTEINSSFGKVNYQRTQPLAPLFTLNSQVSSNMQIENPENPENNSFVRKSKYRHMSSQKNEGQFAFKPLSLLKRKVNPGLSSFLTANKETLAYHLNLTKNNSSFKNKEESQKFRAGYFPDIEIKFKNIFEPLKVLAFEDVEISAQLFIIMVSEIFRKSTHYKDKLVNRFLEILQHMTNSFKFSTTIHETFLKMLKIENIRINPIDILNSGIASNSLSSARLLLEESIISDMLLDMQRETMNRSASLICLAQCLSKTGEREDLNGLLPSLTAQEKYFETYRSKKFKECLEEIQKMVSERNFSMELMPFLDEERRNCLRNLGEWEFLFENLKSKDPPDWNSILSSCINSEEIAMNFSAEFSKLSNIFISKSGIAYESAILSIKNGDFDRAKYLCSLEKETILENWAKHPSFLQKKRLIGRILLSQELNEALSDNKMEIRSWATRFPSLAHSSAELWNTWFSSREIMISSSEESAEILNESQIRLGEALLKMGLVQYAKNFLKSLMKKKAAGHFSFELLKVSIKLRLKQVAELSFEKNAHAISSLESAKNILFSQKEKYAEQIDENKDIKIFALLLKIDFFIIARMKRGEGNGVAISRLYKELKENFERLWEKALKTEFQSNTLRKYANFLENYIEIDSSSISLFVEITLLFLKTPNVDHGKIMKLLNIISHLRSDDPVVKYFLQQMEDFPIWVFLDVMIKNFDYSKNQTLEKIYYDLAKLYPHLMVYPSYLHGNKLLMDVAFNNVPGYRQFFQGLNFLTHPEHRLTFHLESLKKELDSEKCDWEKISLRCEKMEEDFFPEEMAVMGSYNKDFSLKWKTKIKVIINLANEVKNKTQISQAIKKTIDGLQRGIKASSGLQKLSLFSNFLSNFSGNCEIEVPGLYRGGDPAQHKRPKIVGFDQSILVLSSMRKPKRLTIFGSDDKSYTFLVKGGEDLRIDQGVQDIFNFYNGILFSESSLKASVPTYFVQAINESLGIVEWIDDTTLLREFLEGKLKSMSSNYDLKRSNPAFEYRVKWLGELPKKKKWPNPTEIDFSESHYRLLSLPKEEIENNFEETCNQICRNLFKDPLMEICHDSEEFLKTRKKIISNYAAFCAIEYVLGIGDRHLENFLLKKDGEIIPIDFGVCFGTGLSLGVPELVPFRLSNFFIDLISPIGVSGMFKEALVFFLYSDIFARSN